MATETITRLIDDLDGSTADRTVRFGWEGHAYELELSAENIAALEKALKPYLAAARSVTPPARSRPSGPRRSAAGSTSRQPRRDVRGIREWAQAHGYQVTDRGRIPSLVMQAYEAAQ